MDLPVAVQHPFRGRVQYLQQLISGHIVPVSRNKIWHTNHAANRDELHMTTFQPWKNQFPLSRQPLGSRNLLSLECSVLGGVDFPGVHH